MYAAELYVYGVFIFFDTKYGLPRLDFLFCSEILRERICNAQFRFLFQ